MNNLKPMIRYSNNKFIRFFQRQWYNKAKFKVPLCVTALIILFLI